MTKPELIREIVKLQEQTRELILKNEELKKQIPCTFEAERYRKIGESNERLLKERDDLRLIKKQAEFIMSKIS